MAADDHLRIGRQDREDALAALEVHRDAGRLDAFEYEDRCGRARDAVTKGDVRALFTDLPEPRPALTDARAAIPRRAERAAALEGPAGRRPRRTVGQILVGISPFIALAGFALTRAWVCFLLIPVLAIIGKALDE